MTNLKFCAQNLLKKKMKKEKRKEAHKKTFCGQSEIFKNISWPINICFKYFIVPKKTREIAV